MPPVWRHNRGTLWTPRPLIERIDWLFAVSDGCADDFGLYRDEAAALERLVTLLAVFPVPQIPTMAEALSDARNVLDSWTLSDECRDADTGSLDVRPNWDDPVGEGCGFCMWCQALVLRDWCDAVLDRAGFPRPPCLTETPADYDPAAHYDRLATLASARYSAMIGGL